MDKRILTILLVIVLCLPILSSADTIVLKSGQKIEGKIIEKTDKHIKIDFQGVPVTYFIDEIERIDSPSVTPIQNSNLITKFQLSNKMPGYREPSQQSNAMPYKDWIQTKEIKDYLNSAQAINMRSQQAANQPQGKNALPEMAAKLSAYINDLRALYPPAELSGYHNKLIEAMGYMKMQFDENNMGSFKYMRLGMVSTIESTEALRDVFIKHNAPQTVISGLDFVINSLKDKVKLLPQ